MRRLLLSAALLVGATALLAGCGGGGGGDSTSSSSGTSAGDWAAAYCNNATGWVTSIDHARASVKTGTTPSDAAQTATQETTTFIQQVDGLGAPDTPNGSTSEATAKSLATTLSGRMARISAAIDTNNPDVTAAQQRTIVQQQIAASLNDVSTTNAKLAKDDPELGTAMKASADCTALNAALVKAKA